MNDLADKFRAMIPEAWLDFPQHVGIELSSRCPLACVMCPQRFLERPQREMDRALAEKLLDDVVAKRPMVMPQGMGELFLHQEWREILRYAIDECGLDIVVLTHGSFLDEDTIEALLDLGPMGIVIGIEGATRATHQAVTQRDDFDIVVNGTRRLLQRRSERGLVKPAVRVRLTPNPLNQHEAAAFVAFWQPLLGEDETADVNIVCNTWAGSIPEEFAPREPYHGPRAPCPQLWMHLNVYEDGRTTPCCIDAEAAIHVGDASTTSIEAIWHGEQLAAYREAHLEGRFDDVPLCGSCGDWINYVRAVDPDWGRGSDHA